MAPSRRAPSLADGRTALRPLARGVCTKEGRSGSLPGGRAQTEWSRRVLLAAAGIPARDAGRGILAPATTERYDDVHSGGGESRTSERAGTPNPRERPQNR